MFEKLSERKLYFIVLLAVILVGILFWKVIVMPYQQGKDIRGCIDGKLEGGPRSLEYAQTAVDVCTARAKYPAF